ncbi:MAG: ABC transporter ATP-binding protein [Solirubrobacterales bacterium]
MAAGVNSPAEVAPAVSSALAVEGLRIETAAGDAIVEDVSLHLRPGEVLGLVGESGCGKTTTSLAMLGYTTPGTRFAGGEVVVGGRTLPIDSDSEMRSIRGSLVSYVPQNPGTAMNPSLRVAGVIEEMIDAHGRDGGSETTVEQALETVGLPGDRDFQRRYPHQISGGQQQRVCTAIALVCEPPVVILDEPTTGLDVVTQARILTELRRLCKERSVAMLYVTHDLAVVAQLADRIAVMYAGRVVEQGSAVEVLARPKHPYTRGLIQSIPDHLSNTPLEPMPGVAVGVGERGTGCSFAPRCPLRIEACLDRVPEPRQVGVDHHARCIRVDQVEPVSHAAVPPVSRPKRESAESVLSVAGLRAGYRQGGVLVPAATDVSFEIAAGRCVALVGESGSGKTTVARSVAGLHPIAAGTIKLEGETLGMAKRRTTAQRRRMQMIFQNPYDALNPRQTIASTISRPARVLRRLSRRDASAEVDRLLELVRMPKRLRDRYPSELSGGECQRVGIARALAAGPDLLICDEITSALDVSSQAAALALLDELRDDLGLSLLFITHDLGVVATIADTVLVLNAGIVCESGPTDEVLSNPRDDYTKRLLDSAPSISQVLASRDSAA